jgi:Putative peptidoglycan binding domain
MAGAILKSVGSGGINRPEDVRTVQELINNNLKKMPSVRPLEVDGRIGSLTIAAIEEFQRRVVGMPLPDGRVDPGGRTLAALNLASPSASPTTSFRVVFQHQSKTPEDTSSTKGTDALYESKVAISEGAGGSFRGSIYPDDMSVKGRLKDGTYDLYLGFHKREGHTPGAADLVVRTQGFRAALIVKADAQVPVISNNPSKTTSQFIHVHNGFNTKRFSDGCPTIHPADWSKFIKVFLDAYSSLSDWTAMNAYVGKKIGVLEVKA